MLPNILCSATFANCFAFPSANKIIRALNIKRIIIMIREDELRHCLPLKTIRFNIFQEGYALKSPKLNGMAEVSFQAKMGCN